MLCKLQSLCQVSKIRTRKRTDQRWRQPTTLQFEDYAHRKPLSSPMHALPSSRDSAPYFLPICRLLSVLLPPLNLRHYFLFPRYHKSFLHGSFLHWTFPGPILASPTHLKSCCWSELPKNQLFPVLQTYMTLHNFKSITSETPCEAHGLDGRELGLRPTEPTVPRHPFPE